MITEGVGAMYVIFKWILIIAILLAVVSSFVMLIGIIGSRFSTRELYIKMVRVSWESVACWGFVSLTSLLWIGYYKADFQKILEVLKIIP